MEHESPLPGSTQLTLILAGLAVVGVASCFSGGLALLGLAGLLTYLVATAQPDPDGSLEAVEPEPCEIASAEPLPEPTPCPAQAIERDASWQTRLAVRQDSSAGLSPMRAGR